jgi:hypothetical protein
MHIIGYVTMLYQLQQLISDGYEAFRLRWILKYWGSRMYGLFGGSIPLFAFRKSGKPQIF